MDLYVIRHAEAVAQGERGVTKDEERPLTEHGEQQAQALGAGLPALGVQLDLILTSPLVRARQTADNLLKQWRAGHVEVEECNALAPPVRPRKLARTLNGADKQAVAIVGHEPSLSAWLAWLIGSKKAQVQLVKASVALVRVEGGVCKGAGQLAWLVPPAWFMNERHVLLADGRSEKV
jgi:phosphohistidine phosphatase